MTPTKSTVLPAAPRSFESARTALIGELLGDELGDDLCARVLERAVHGVPGVTCGSLLARGEDGRYRFVASVAHDLAALQGVSFGPDEIHLGSPGQGCAVVEHMVEHNVRVLDEARAAVISRAVAPLPRQATLVVPVRLGEEVAATLNLDSPLPPRELGDEAVRLAELFGAQVGLALQHLRLQRENVRARRELALLSAARAALARDLDLPALFEAVEVSLRDICGYPHVGVGLIEDGWVVFGKARYPLSRGVMGRVARTGQAALVRDVRREAEYIAQFPGVVSELCVPLRDEGRVIGVLNVETRDAPLTLADLKLMAALGEHLGGAVERARLHAQTRQSEARFRALYAEAERQRSELELLHRVRTALAAELEVGDLLRAVCGAISQAFGYTQVSVYLLREGVLELQHDVGYERMPARLPVTVGVMGRVAREGRPCLIPDVQADPDFQKAAENTTSEVAVPLRRHGEVVGVLNVESVNGARLGEADLRLIVAAGESIDLALARAELLGEVRASEARYRLLAENMSDLVCLHDAVGRFHYVSPSARSLLDRDAADLLGALPSALLHPDDVACARRELFLPALRGDKPPPARLRLRRGSAGKGEYRWFETSVTPITREGKVVQLLTASRDIHERAAVEARLAHLATHDALTDLPNRALLRERLQTAVERGRGGTPDYAVLFLDVDRFKVINDSLGHRAGDELLVALGKRLCEVMRAGDTVSRLGGDEFAVLLEGLSDSQDAELAARRVEAALAEPFCLAGRELRVAFSIGIAPGQKDYEDAQDVLRDADLSMYRAKRGQGGGHAVFDRGLRDSALRRLQIEADLPRALARGELRVVYQPIVTLEDGTLRGFEALSRWTHPTLGFVSPLEFVGVAEETGLIADLGERVLRDACAKLRTWQDLHPALPLSMNVNVSPRQFRLPGLADTVARAAAQTGCDLGRLNLEITESAIMDDPAAAARVLAELRALGVRIQVDDFGTGYSSLASLHRFPIDALKIDRSFVTRLGDDELSSSIVQTVITLARALNLTAIAEGVETQAQRSRLRALGCRVGQGYLFARPLESRDADDFVGRAETLG